MSSLLQFSGNTGKRGIELQFYQTTPKEGDMSGIACLGNDAELVPCAICGNKHNRLWVAWRKPRGMFGPWVIFEYNGKMHVPDLSIPIATFKLPRDAKPLNDKQNSEYWHKG